MTPERRQSREKKKTVSIPLATKFHQSQLPAIPRVATNPVTTSGVSAANVVATIDVPASHHGTLRPESINETKIAERLYTPDMPPPDLLIRTSGEQRISNFLPWQCAYSELVFSPALWPDFSRDDLQDALQEYESRQRRFGGR